MVIWLLGQNPGMTFNTHLNFLLHFLTDGLANATRHISPYPWCNLVASWSDCLAQVLSKNQQPSPWWDTNEHWSPSCWLYHTQRSTECWCASYVCCSRPFHSAQGELHFCCLVAGDFQWFHSLVTKGSIESKEWLASCHPPQPTHSQLNSWYSIFA